ncbi:super-infection exclusion protein B [uncultured Ruegeria sp.]|uniref:super-infection exclusion protein B n=1 Tax=uncultured Ruegeria sp. TaxID=259304 RepID=UPI00344C1D54
MSGDEEVSNSTRCTNRDTALWLGGCVRDQQNRQGDLVAGCLFASSVIAALSDLFNSWNRVRKQKAKALEYLDQLSLDELRVVHKAIDQDSPSITWPYDSPPIAPLVGSGLLVQHGGRFPGDYWPLHFRISPSRKYKSAKMNSKRCFVRKRQKNWLSAEGGAENRKRL